VISEASFLLGKFAGYSQPVLELVAGGAITIDFVLAKEMEAVKSLTKRFSNVPMSIADACLVRMTELEPDSAVLTLDSDFRLYRRNRRQVVPTIMPG
jgi:predicted nucleic acid-binding protein